MAVVLITGSSAGLGRETALALARRGHTVFATMRAPQPLGDGIDVLALDVTRPETIARAAAAIIERAGRLDVVINNAGVGVASAAVEELTDEALRAVLETNVFGVLHVVRAVAPALRAQGSGHVINVGSVSGRVSRPYGGAYAASKHALEALNDALFWELLPFGVHVTLFEPGFLATDIHRREVPIAKAQPSPYAADETSFAAALAALERSADPAALAAQALADVVESDTRARRVVFGAGAKGLLAIADALASDATSPSFASAIAHHSKRS